MSGLEIPGFLVGVAGLFSSCVDAFGYFKLAQHADKDIEVVLLKLDIEKTRLLIWGENVGLFTAGGQNPRLRDEHVVDIIRRILIQVESLLTDSEKLRASYGAQNLDTSLERAVDYISRKSLNIFRTSASRFWTRNSSKLAAAPQRSRATRIKWAIYEKEKFQALVNHLSDLVDRLYELQGLSVAREIQDRTIIEDIESIVDISQLAIIEEATEGSYQAYSQAAASTRARTEAGTVDRRTLEELLTDTEGTGETHSRENRHATNSAGLDSLWSELGHFMMGLVTVLTSPCRKLRTQDPCDSRRIAAQANFSPLGRHLEWDISSRNSKGGNALWQRIERLVRGDIRRKVEDNGVLGELLKVDNEYLSEEQSAYISQQFPFLELLIYCPPCVCTIHTALSIGMNLKSPFLKTYIRPDDRLASSCCVDLDRTVGLRNILEHVRKWESEAGEHDADDLVSFIDSVWLDRRLDHLDYEQPYTYREESSGHPPKRILVIGEVDHLAALLQKASGRIPKATELWNLRPLYSGGAARSLLGRFIERSIPSHPASQPQTSSASRPLSPSMARTVSAHGAQQVQEEVTSGSSGLKRAASAQSSDSKRRRSDMGSPEESGSAGGASSEDMVMEDDGHVVPESVS